MRADTSPSEAWAWIGLIVMAIGYLFNIPGLLGLAGLMAVLFGLAWMWDSVSFQGLTYRRRLHYRKGFAGETTECEVTVENRKLLPLLWLRINDAWPRVVGPSDENLLAASHRDDLGTYELLLSIRSYARLRRRFEVTYRSRGVFRVGPAAGVSGDPFGLFVRRRDSLTPAEKVVVYPRLRPLAPLGMAPDDPFGERPSRRRLFEDPTRPMGIRDYRPEDGFRRIHWPATARMGTLQTRVFEPVRGLDMIVCLNASTYERYWEGTNPHVLEALIETSASLVVDAFQSGYRVGLISNGSLAHAGQAFRIRPGRSSQHLPQLLEALAAVTPLVTAPFERFLMQQAPALEFGSVLVVVTAITPDALLESLLRLKARSRRTILLSLAENPPPPVRGVQTIHLPVGEAE